MFNRHLLNVSRIAEIKNCRNLHFLRNNLSSISHLPTKPASNTIDWSKSNRYICIETNRYTTINKWNLPQSSRSISTSTALFLADEAKDKVIFISSTPEINSTNQNVASSSTEMSSTASQMSTDVSNLTDVTTVATEALNSEAGRVFLDPPFASLGLGGWTPVGLVQNAFEFLHVSMDIPWWGCIMIGTIVVRLLMFPLVVKAQRNAAKMHNHMPELQRMQVEMTEARQTGNQMEAARLAQDIMLFMKEKDMNPLKNIIVPLAQAPLFISFFIGLREMANLPLASMKCGGLWWFSDLTVTDQFYLLPIITSATMYLTIELGTDSARLSSQNMQTMRYVLRALPVLILPFTINFPGAILVYWCSSNFISLVQVGFLKIPSVRQYFKIDQLVTHDAQKLPMKPKKFVEGLKDSWTNMKLTQELQERERINAMSFQKAGRGPLVKTYKYDPTKQVAAKKKD